MSVLYYKSYVEVVLYYKSFVEVVLYYKSYVVSVLFYKKSFVEGDGWGGLCTSLCTRAR